MKNWMMWIAAAIALAVVVYFLSEQVQNRVERGKGPSDDAPVANFAVNGKPIKLDDLKGKVVLADYWAVWCGPCIATFPHLREWHKRYKQDGLEIVGITEPTGRATLEKFATKHNLEHLLMTVPGSEFGSALQKFSKGAIPCVVLHDRKGEVRMVRVGAEPENARAIEAEIKKLLAEKS